MGKGYEETAVKLITSEFRHWLADTTPAKLFLKKEKGLGSIFSHTLQTAMKATKAPRSWLPSHCVTHCKSERTRFILSHNAEYPSLNFGKCEFC